MAEVYESTIKVETGKAERSVRELKNEINDLRDEILNLEEGTDEYAAAVAKLQADQRDLNTVMGLTKQTAVALEGSYDALTHKMSLLKKEWRATNDEAKRNELSREIAEINSQLKTLDAEIGNYQRNVGNYPQKMAEGFQELDTNLETVNTHTGDFGSSMREAMESVEPMKAKFESVQKIASGIASGFAAVQGAAALLGVENENLEKTFVQLQAAMALAQGIGGLGDLVEGATKAKVAFKELATSIKIASKAIGKGGWIGIIIAAIAVITGLVTWLVKQNKAMKDGVTTTKEYNKAMTDLRKETYESVAADYAKIKALKEIATQSEVELANGEKVINNYDKREKAAMLLLSTMKMEINTMNTALVLQGFFNDEIDATANKLMDQAEAQAALNLITAKYVELFEAQIKAQKNGWVSNREKKKIKGIKNELEGLIKFISESFTTSRGIVDMIFPENVLDDLAKQLERKLNGIEFVSGFKGITKQMQDELNSVNFNLELTDEEKAKKSYEITVKYLKKQKQAYEEYKGQISPAYFDSYTEYAEYIEQTDIKIYELETQLAQATYEEKQRLRELDEQKEADYRSKLLTMMENKYQREQQLIEISNKTDEEKANESYLLEVQYLGSRLEVLRKFLNEAMKDEEKNKDLIFDLRQQIADGLLAIDVAAYNDAERKQKEHLEKMNKQLADAGTEADRLQRKNAITDYVDYGDLSTWQGRKAYEKNDELNERARADKAYEIEQETLSKRLGLLKSFYDSALAMGEQEKALEFQQQVADTELEIEESKYENMRRLREQDLADARSKKEKYVSVMMDISDVMGGTAQLMQGITQIYENTANKDEEITEEEAKKIKGLKYATGTIEMLQGAIAAYAGAQSLGVPMGPIIGGINAAAVVAMGIANLQQIKNTDLTGGSNPAPHVPTPSAMGMELPATYTRQITGLSEMEELNRDTKVYILESDIVESGKRVQIRQNESSF